jgi:GNAT superfamily N-acetyltransferase
MSSAAERIRVARRIAELEKLVNRDKSISASELKTRARAESEPDGLFGGKVSETAPAKTDSFNGYIKDMRAKIEAKRAPVRAAVGDGKRPAEFQTGPESVEVISREPRDPSKWRVTHFTPDGPVGHQEYSKLEDAIAQVAGSSGEAPKPVKGKVQAWMFGDRWKTRHVSEIPPGYGGKPASKAEVEKWAEQTKQSLGLRHFNVYVNAQGALELADIEVAKDARQQGIGTKALEALTQFADEHGQRILLTPALKDPKHGTTSRGRLVRFYKRFGFVLNKGRNKDFTTMQGMYRDPQTPKSARQKFGIDSER